MSWLAFLLAFSPSAEAKWEMSDLSLLMPLPEPGAQNRLWHARTTTRGGALLPKEVYDSLPMLVVLRDREWLYDSLRVVAARIDPCFAEGNGPCRRQVRFVWQPMEEIRGSFTTLDAAAHTFHELSDQDWANLIAGLERLKKLYPLPSGQALGVHPHLASSGIQGAFGREFARLLFSVCGPLNLVRATAMTVNTEGTVWVFTGFDIKNGKHERFLIPRVNNRAQAFFSDLENALEFRATMNPFPANEASFLSFLRDSSTAERELGEDEIAKAVRSSLVALNPKLSNPGTIDCASCHAARAVPLWAELRFPSWNWNGMFAGELFRGEGNLTNISASPRRTNVLRAFGYFNRDPILSPRTIFETSLAVESMNARFKP